LIVTAPEATVKSAVAKDASPLSVVVASSPVTTGDVNVLFVKVCIPVSDTSTASAFPIAVPPGSFNVFVAFWLCG